MEKRKSAMKTLNQCRFCLSTEESLSSIYDRSRTPKNTVTLPLQILSCVSVEVFPSDGMPSLICDCCRFFMDVCYRYKQICRSADESLLLHVQSGESLEPIPWALKLKRIYQHASRPSKKVKTLVSESGATVQVTASNDITESEDDDDNTYNIKIDGADSKEGPCIKVIKDGEELIISKDQLLADKKVKANKSTDTNFPCKFCDRVFTKGYHYSRHLRAKHKDVKRVSRGPFGHLESFRCDQCSEEFVSQDELIYHSAKHATENLTCPLCQEKFDHVEEVSAHIKTHVEGAEFMCDLCELVFTTRHKLDAHLGQRHREELKQEQELDDDSTPMDEDEEETSNINVTEENGEMVVEIRKAADYIMEDKSADDSNLNTNSEESETEASYLDVPGEDESPTPAPPAPSAPTPPPPAPPAPSAPPAPTAPPVPTAPPPVPSAPAAPPAPPAPSAPAAPPAPPVPPVLTTPRLVVAKQSPKKATTILKKAEEIKKQTQKAVAVEQKVDTPEVKSTSPSPAPAAPAPALAPAAPATADKSLRLLEKELQDLQRTNSRSEPAKTPAKGEPRARGRPQLHTSTPKPRAGEEKRAQSSKTPAVEKKVPEKRTPLTKENKEPKEPKGTNNTTKDDKDKETPKSVKNGSERTSTEENVRRSSRNSKVQDYAKMDKPMNSSDDSDDENDEEYTEVEPKPAERSRTRRVVSKPPPKAQSASPAPEEPSPAPTRKRGRPRKGIKEVPSKISKISNLDESKTADEEEQPSTKEEEKLEPKKNAKAAAKEAAKEAKAAKPAEETPKQAQKEQCANAASDQAKPAGVLVSPTGHALKKVSASTLPPGVKAMPLPARTVTGGVCEMQIGKKVVKVQKIVMTKAELEAMTKKGLVEVKDGTVVLKPGIKLPTSEMTTLKSFVSAEGAKKQTPKKPLPSRCDFGDD